MNFYLRLIGRLAVDACFFLLDWEVTFEDVRTIHVCVRPLDVFPIGPNDAVSPVHDDVQATEWSSPEERRISHAPAPLAPATPRTDHGAWPHESVTALQDFCKSARVTYPSDHPCQCYTQRRSVETLTESTASWTHPCRTFLVLRLGLLHNALQHSILA